MKISMWSLCDYLIKKGFIVEDNISEGTPCVSLIKQSKERSYSPDYAEIIQIGNDVRISNDMDTMLVKDSDMIVVANALGEAMEFYNQWERSLYECILRKGSLQELLDIAKSIFERPMFIKNDSTRTLAITHGYSDDVHPYWEKMTKSNGQKIPDYELVSGVSSDPEYRMAFTDRYPSVRFSPVYGGMVLHANIFVNERRAAEVVTLENGKPFNKGDIHIMNVFTDMIVKYVASDKHIFQNASDISVSLKSLLETGNVEKEQIANVTKFMGIDENSELCLAVITGADRIDSPVLSVLREKLETQLKDAAVLHFSGQVIVLRVLRKGTYDELIEDFKRRIPKEGFRWGLSYEFKRIEDLQLFYKQTCHILEQAQFDHKNYITVYEVASKMISELCEKNETTKTFVHPDLLRLEHMDIKDNTEYCETLFYYLLCGGNFTDAAKIMNLHRNTLIYRLNKIREIIHSNLDDISNRKLLIYSYLLMNKEY